MLAAVGALRWGRGHREIHNQRDTFLGGGWPTASPLDFLGLAAAGLLGWSKRQREIHSQRNTFLGEGWTTVSLLDQS